MKYLLNVHDIILEEMLFGVLHVSYCKLVYLK